MFRNKLHRKIFIIGTVLLAAALPLSPFIVSVSQLILAINWIFIQPDLRSRITLIFKRKSILLLISIFLIHIVWLINSDNIVTYAFHDLKIKAPLFALPIIYGTSAPLTKRELNFIFHTYILSCLVAIGISVVIYFNLTRIEVNDIREISPIISHIRLSLLIVLASFIVVYILTLYPDGLIWHKFIYSLILFVYLIFIPWLGAITGTVILLVVMPIAVLIWIRAKATRKKYFIGFALIIFITLCCFAYLYYALNRFTQRNPIVESNLPRFTLNGNTYCNDFSKKEYENQYPVWVLISEIELAKEWNKRSTLDFEGYDLKNQFLKTTLIRYMTSMGLAKDSIGISKMTDEDIRMVENGYTNYLFKYKWSVYPRFYQIFWEIEYYIRGGNPSGHSLTQRVEYLKNAIHVIKNHFWFGTGTGDPEQEIMKQYETDHSQLTPEWRKRAHNQSVTFFLTFGLLGFLWIVFAIGYAIFLERKNADFIFICFLFIFLLSTLNEDTLETQIGATFYAYFLAMLLLGRNLSDSKENKEFRPSKLL